MGFVFRHGSIDCGFDGRDGRVWEPTCSSRASDWWNMDRKGTFIFSEDDREDVFETT